MAPRARARSASAFMMVRSSLLTASLCSRVATIHGIPRTERVAAGAAPRPRLEVVYHHPVNRHPLACFLVFLVWKIRPRPPETSLMKKRLWVRRRSAWTSQWRACGSTSRPSEPDGRSETAWDCLRCSCWRCSAPVSLAWGLMHRNMHVMRTDWEVVRVSVIGGQVGPHQLPSLSPSFLPCSPALPPLRRWLVSQMLFFLFLVLARRSSTVWWWNATEQRRPWIRLLPWRQPGMCLQSWGVTPGYSY